MPANAAVWGIEIGQCALKALKLRPADDGQLELVAFDLIEHPKILSQPDADPDELIRASLEKFVSRNELGGDRFVIGVPGQQTFSRFTKLPPVEEKKVADIVRYEAQQQIPFDMNDVVWDYEVFRGEGTPDVEVGIFAMRKDLVRKQIDYYTAHRINPAIIQTVPSALYNFCRFDEQGTIGEGQATVIVDVGAQKTDLIIVEPNSAWSRNIPLGGNNFTEALVKAFKRSFAQAEQLKRTAASNKYARQIFQAMRPVFAELVAEIQRSLGFYSSTHRDVRLQQVLACGNAFRLPGLQKYLENNLTIPDGVAKLEKFNKLIATPTTSAPEFTENILSFAAAYGLAVQGLGLAKIQATLLPPEMARIAMWKGKQPYWIGAAATLLLASALPWTRNVLDSAALASNSAEGDQARSIIQQHSNLAKEFAAANQDTGGKQAQIEKLFELQKDRALVPAVLAMVHEAVPVQPELRDVASADDMKKRVEQLKSRLPRTQRKQVYIDAVEIRYSKNIDAEPRTPTAGPVSGGFSSRGGFGDVVVSGRTRGGGGGGEEPAPEESGGEGQPGFYVHVRARTTYGTDQFQVVQFVTSEFYDNLRRVGRRPNQGFYLPESDPKAPNREKLNLGDIVANSATQAQPTYAPAGNRTGSGAINLNTGSGNTDSTAPKNVDPVTGEDMSTDWEFAFDFKLKLGEMPAEQPAEGESSGS